MINPDDLDPPRPVLKPIDMQQMSITDLRVYIVSLEKEIARAAEMIGKKEAHRSGVEGLFGKSVG